jgi:hypothetical protein
MTAISNPVTVPGARSRADEAIRIKRRTVDSVSVAVGGVLTAGLAVAGALLLWGANFSGDFVHDELASQNIAFPPAAALADEGRTDLMSHAGQDVSTGSEARAYASYIGGHLEGIAGGQTYADLGTPEREAKAAVDAAKASGADAAEVASLQATADAISGQRNTLFKGETLRGLLLSAYAWATVGMIAGYAAIAAFAAAGVMLVLVALGARHHHQLVAAQR